MITKKKYILTYILVIGLFLLGGGMLALAAILQNSGVEGIIVTVIGLSSFPILVIDIVIMYKNFGKLTAYETMSKYEKIKESDTNRLSRVQVSIDSIEDCFSDIEYLKLEISEVESFEDTLECYWVYSKSIMMGTYSLLVRNISADSIEIEESDDEDEMIDLSPLLCQIPKKGLTKASVSIYFYSGDTITEDQIETAEQFVALQKSLSKTMNSYAPLNLVYLYDKTSKILYYENNKKHPLVQREIVLKRFNKFFLENGIQK